MAGSLSRALNWGNLHRPLIRLGQVVVNISWLPGWYLVEESPLLYFFIFFEIFRSVFSCPPRAPGEHASADEANGYRDLLQMDHEEAPAHFHRVDDFQLRAGVEQHLHGG